MSKIINLDKIFENYMKTFVEQNKDNYTDFAELENDLYNIYEKWTELPSEELCGISPKEYVDNLAKNGELFYHIDTLIENDIEVSDLVTFKAVTLDGAEQYFKKLLANSDYDLKLYGALALQEIEGADVVDEFVELALEPQPDASLQTIVYEYLTDNHEEVVDKLLPRLYEVDDEVAKFALEILAVYKGRKDIYMWLVTMLYRGDDVMLFAHLLGGYGDTNAIETLSAFAREAEITYLEYIEIRNAIEELGGVCEVERDFSEDEYYKEYILGEKNE